ncbi:hypothetical protein [Blastomonas sp.]|uniref:hypothetical protein n=1 Tax=Blastomonas sp. TaxID=1909299 RepID=UPI00359412DE
MTHKSPKLVFEYRYRDAANYKIEGRVFLNGGLTIRQRNAIQTKMESEEFFVAEQVGIPPLAEKLFEFGGGPTSEDHAWHEFDGFRTMSSDFQATERDIIMNAEKLFDAFNAVDSWKPEISPNFV